MPHYRSQRLSDNLRALLGAFRDLTASGSYRRLCVAAGLQHHWKGLEITWGQRNGFHPHLHVLGFFSSGFAASGFPEALVGLWFGQLQRHGVEMRDAAAVLERGINFKLGFTAGAEYVSKVGQAWGLAEEVAKANRKRGRFGHHSPADLLRLVRDTDSPEAAAIYREYAAAVKGVHMLQASRGLRAALGLEEEKSDEEIAGGVDQVDPVLVTLTPWQWRAVRHFGWRARVRVVELADFDEDAARAYVLHLVSSYEENLAGGGSWAAD
jgi:hypothetical protein